MGFPARLVRYHPRCEHKAMVTTNLHSQLQASVIFDTFLEKSCFMENLDCGVIEVELIVYVSEDVSSWNLPGQTRMKEIA